MMDILFYHSQPGIFLNAIEAANLSMPSADQFRLQSTYNAAYFGENYQDHSFLVIKDGHVKALVICHEISGMLGMNGHGGIKAYYAAPEKNTMRAIYDAIENIASQRALQKTLICDEESGHEIGAFGYEAFKRDYTPAIVLKAEINLTLEDKEIHAGVRDSYRSLIRAAKDELSIHAMTSDNADADVFENFRKFHIQVAGRETRSHESWQCQFEMIKAGCAELLMATMDGHGLVSASFFTDYGPLTSYAVAVYNRDLFEKPLAHALIYEEIFRAKARGQQKFFLGVLPAKASVSEKEYSISKFKKGFCNRPVQNIEWFSIK